MTDNVVSLDGPSREEQLEQVKEKIFEDIEHFVMCKTNSEGTLEFYVSYMPIKDVLWFKYNVNRFLDNLLEASIEAANSEGYDQ